MATALPNLIQLKHTIIEGRVPSPTLLETGEVALGLFKGQESIWLKNTNNEIVNIRSPRHDLMWGDIFKKFDTRTEFETALRLGKVKETSIVFIEDVKAIWTEGSYYNSVYSSEELEAMVANLVIAVPENVFSLDSTSTSEIISECFGGVEGFEKLFNLAYSKSTPISGMVLPDGGSVPVSISPKIDLETESKELTFEWMFSGEYITLNIIFKNDIFSLNRSTTDIKTLGSRLDDLEKKVGSGENFTWNDVI